MSATAVQSKSAVKRKKSAATVLTMAASTFLAALRRCSGVVEEHGPSGTGGVDDPLRGSEVAAVDAKRVRLGEQ